MCEVKRYGIGASRVGRNTGLTTHAKLESPAELAATKAAQLHSLLLMTPGSALEQFVSMDAAIQESLLSLAADLALEITVLSELELEHVQDGMASVSAPA
ncbi:hypothetical protein P3W85_11035 [Cupriavidus basilensis]|uniref:Uncharacterized protein n=1 Tax=Cupriavidus basilensis TaxID=68895 RepID=A0ABT6ALJ7_9BURK|nr:hypothetical protein [Cupriavidus basilensis]MDF3833479.1 hypothetical protein [Cupriavidus basilensis]